MLKKIISIKNIGRFENYSASGDLELHKLTLMYGENGRGKTTVCAILRSLQTQDSKYIFERHTSGATDSPDVSLRAENGNINFKNEKWNKHDLQLEIFDSVFVNENVFSGNYVDIDHRRNLLHFALGQQGVGLARDNDNLDTTIKEKNSEIKSREAEVKAFASNELGLGIDDFLKLQAIPDIEKQIADNDKVVQSLFRSNSLLKQPSLTELLIPPLDFNSLELILTKQIADLSIEAEKFARSHFTTHNIPEHWIEEGLDFLIENDRCPFCGCDLNQSELVSTFRGYFTLAYSEHKSQITEYTNSFNTNFPIDFETILKGSNKNNKMLVGLWDDYITIKNPEIDIDEICKFLENVRSSVSKVLKRKSEIPLEQIPFSDDLLKAKENYNKSLEYFSKYNDVIKSINAKIEETKESVGGGNLITAQQKLEQLNLTKKRFEPLVSSVCDDYLHLLEEKRQFDIQKKKVQEDLDGYTKFVLKKYETDINQYLDKFGAEFRIVETKAGFSGGKSTSSYRIEVNQQKIDLGDYKSSGELSFKTVLSEGDKNALAFAFFISRLEQDPDLENKIIVIDDPVSSMDQHRKNFTCQTILKIMQKAKQVMVLSHDPYFLSHINDGAFDVRVASLKLARVGQETAITEWDIYSDIQDDYYKNYDRLFDFLDIGTTELHDVIRCIRPLLEGNLRSRFPRDFRHGESLGHYIEKIRGSNTGDRIYVLQKDIEDLTSMNDYATTHHHGSNIDSEIISDTELQTFVRLALSFVHR